MKIAFCTPSINGPTKPYIEAMEQSIPLIRSAGHEDVYIQEVGCPYISNARATMLRKALNEKCDIIVFIDYDLSWDAKDLLTLVETEGDCVSGLYRFKKDEEEYMGTLKCNHNFTPKMNRDGTIQGDKIPAGFMKMTLNGVRKFMRAYPELLYGDPDCYSIDLFNHGAFEGVWYGEDYSFSRRWNDKCGEIKIIPNLNLNHHSKDKEYKGNFHEFLLKQPRPE